MTFDIEALITCWRTSLTLPCMATTLKAPRFLDGKFSSKMSEKCISLEYREWTVKMEWQSLLMDKSVFQSYIKRWWFTTPAGGAGSAAILPLAELWYTFEPIKLDKRLNTLLVCFWYISIWYLFTHTFHII